MQQVNFYQDDLKKTEPAYSATILVIVMVCCLVIGVLVTASLMIITQLKKTELSEYQLKVAQLNQVLATTRKNYPAPVIDQAIVKKIEALSERKSRNKKVLKYLSTRSFDVEAQSFSQILNAFTEVQEKGLWLTEVKLDKGGSEIKMTGNANNAELLPKYLDQLSELSVFSEMEFEVFNMQRINGQLQFTVSSKREMNDAQIILEKITKSR